MQQLIDQLNLFLREGLTGVKVTRAFNRQEEESRKYDQTNREYTANAIKAGTVMGLFIPLVTLMMGIATLAVVWQGAGAAAAGAAEVGAIMAAITYAAQILLGFSILTNVILMLPRGQVSAKRINEVLETRASLTDGCESGIGSHKSLVFRNVAFGYPEAGKMTLEDISLAVGEGQTLAIIGSTGDGKSTMVSLATRLYDVEKGSVLLNGTDVRNLRQDMICQRISLVPQRSTLFFGTVRSNMQLGKPDASDAEIWAALDMAQASEFVHLLEGGLDAVIDKNGGNFSGGQKQRLCIARALLKDADIYIFDDSFSALDFKTDKAVRTAMRKKTCNAITVIVAQRIATVMEADLIAVLENGRLTGLDTHENLSRTNRVYQEIIASQFQKEVAA
jgi:ABC-type multidrug transport system, ATPase and permease components